MCRRAGGAILFSERSMIVRSTHRHLFNAPLILRTIAHGNHKFHIDVLRMHERLRIRLDLTVGRGKS